MKLSFSAFVGMSLLSSGMVSAQTNGTTLVMDIYNGTTSSYPLGLTYFDGAAYFAANGEGTGVELYTSDGVSTSLLLDINAGSVSSNPAGFTVFKDMLYFRADDGTHGTELWMTDGTESGTSMLMDINEGADGSKPSGFAVLEDYLVFLATTAAAGEELWATDGTMDGTMMISDMMAGAEDADIDLRPEYVVGSSVLFTFNQTLYSTNGAEVTMLKSLGSDTVYLSRPKGDMVSMLYFAMGSEVWVTDGSVNGTTMVMSGVSVGGVSRMSAYDIDGTSFFFAKETGESTDNLYMTDGTPEGTSMLVEGLKDNGRSATGLGFGPVLEGKIAFYTDNGSGTYVWVTDGDDVSELFDTSLYFIENSDVSMAGEQAVFFASTTDGNLEIYVSDYTALNTVHFATFVGGSKTGTGSSVAIDAMDSLFTVATPEYGVELWKMTFPDLLVVTDTPTASPTASPQTSTSNPQNPSPSASAMVSPLIAVTLATAMSFLVSFL